MLALITDGYRLRKAGKLYEQVEQALIGAGGRVKYLQLREQVASEFPANDEELEEIIPPLLELCHQSGAKLICNRNKRLVRTLNCDGLHVGAPLSTILAAKAELESWQIVGYSAHSVAEAKEALNAGAHYVQLSPIFPPLSKSSNLSALGLSGLVELRAELSSSNSTGEVLALGGITAENAASCRQAGADGLAVLSYVLLSNKPADAAKRLVESWAVAYDCN